MNEESRREFLIRLAAVSALLTAGRGTSAVAGPRPFEFLVVGDSIVWGQGLDEKEKFYTLIRDWLERQVFETPREVKLKVKAHSGATMKFHEDEAEKYRQAGRDETFFLKPEVGIASPSVWKQIEVAADEYKMAGNLEGADLIMLNGGINDITPAKIVDPHGDNAKLPILIEKYCGEQMFGVIEHAAKLHPNAMIVVIGYFPMISPKTPSNKLLNISLVANRFPPTLKPFVNNTLIRPIFFEKIRKKAIVRSRIWFDESNKSFEFAVNKLNAKYEKARAVFIKSPITEDTCFETPNTLLFKLKNNGAAEDPLYRERLADCDTALPELKKATGIEYPVRLCEIGSAGHPNPAGGKAYAEAIKSVLGPIFHT